MALQKQPVSINFGKGIETKADKYQIPLGNFEQLHNSIFDTTNRLTKRNGFPKLTSLPNTNQTTLGTLNDNLLATGSSLYAYNSQTDQWFNRGTIQPVSLTVKSMIRNSYSQAGSDLAISDDGLACLVYTQGSSAFYQISDSTTGQQIVSATQIDATATNPRVFLLGRYFIITFTATVASNPHLQYISIPLVRPTDPSVASDISTTIPALSAGYDAYVVDNNMFIAYNDSTDVQLKRLSSVLVLSTATTLTGARADLMSVTADTSGASPIIWLAYWDTSSNDGYAAAYATSMAEVLAPTQVITNEELTHITATAINSSVTVLYEVSNTYAAPYSPSNIQSNYIEMLTCTQTGTASSASVVARSVGLASKALIGPSDVTYFLTAYGEEDQPSYFLMDTTGSIYMRLAYSNGGGYKSTQVLPTITNLNDAYYVPYEIKDLLAAVNKNTNISPEPSTVNAIYTQTGVNLAIFTINETGQYTSEIANSLHLTGGQLWQYDGIEPVEHGFHVYPENVDGSTSASGGSIEDDTYYYQFCYEWTDNQGMIHRSAPSLPFKLVAAGGNTSTNTLYVPNLRLTYKTAVRIVGYRWSISQQTYYQFTSITQPTLSVTSSDYSTIVDTSADASILGQTLLYTTGGVIENIAAPAVSASTLFKNRLFLINAENPNELWFSKQVIQGTPVEMSDLLTLFVAPTTGVQGSTGPMTALSAMDDKLIIFKANAIYYLTGLGPDNTGANNDFTDPVYITSAVGCSNPKSIVLTPQGLMFQSGKGIWLLGRDLSTTYVGAPVEAYNSLSVVSALAIPGTNQVRFTLTNNNTLVYDYYYGQWGMFTNQQAIAGTLYQNAHTYLTSYGAVLQEATGAGSDIDNSKPVLMSLKTGWINLAGLQGFERFYFMQLLGTYLTPFKLNVEIAYDYNSAPSQSVIVTPDNQSGNWGDENLWGGGEAWGGPGNVFTARIFPNIQKCSAFQITITEIYDPSYGILAGAGLTLSGINLIVGMKSGYRTQSSKRSFG